MDTRTERDPLGEHAVPADAYYGIQTARARRELPHQRAARPPRSRHRDRARSRRPRRRPTWRSDVSTRASATRSSARPTRCSPAQLRDQFVVDVYQAGAGTSHNMNANEVLANRAAEILGGARGEYTLRAPQRSRQHGPVHQRRVPDGDAAGAAARACAPLVDAARALAAALARQGRARSTHVLKVGPHASAGRRADHARPGVRRLRRVHRARRRRRRARVGAAARAESRRDRGRHRAQRRRRLHGARGRDISRAYHRTRRRARRESLSRHAEHGRRARLLGRDAAAGRGAGEGRERSAAAQHGTARRASRRSRCRPCSPDRRSCRAR